jgi:hypothetical protein
MLDLAGKQIRLKYPSGAEVMIPFTTSKHHTAMPISAVREQQAEAPMAVRMPYTAVLPPGQPLMLEVPIAASEFNRSTTWDWEPADTAPVQEEDCMIRLTSHSVISAVWEAEQKEPMLQQVMMNCTKLHRRGCGTGAGRDHWLGGANQRSEINVGGSREYTGHRHGISCRP